MENEFEFVRNKLMTHKFLYNKNGNLNPNLKKSLDAGTKEQIAQLFSTLEFSAAIYCLIHNLSEIPTCIECNAPVKFFYNFTLGFSKFCCIQCSRKNSISKDKRRNTCISRYGTENAKQNTCVKEKTKQNNIEKYGIAIPQQLPEIRKKISTTVLDTYNKSNESIQHKKKVTFDLRYGMHPNLTDQVKEQKIHNTLEK